MAASSCSAGPLPAEPLVAAPLVAAPLLAAPLLAASAKRRVPGRERRYPGLRAAGFAALILAAIGAPATAQNSTSAQASGQSVSAPAVPEQAVYVTAHVDVTPAHVDETIRVIRDYVAAARQEVGAMRIDAIQEPRPNHFDLIEVWRDPATHDAHEANAATISFHDQIHPWRGSPFEERLGHRIAP